MSEKFWMVYGVNKGAPTMRHPSSELAEREAERLARNNPGVTFCVLEAVLAVTKSDIKKVRLGFPPEGDDWIPW